MFIDDGDDEDDNGNPGIVPWPAPPAGGSHGDVEPIDDSASDIPEQTPRRSDKFPDDSVETLWEGPRA